MPEQIQNLEVCLERLELSSLYTTPAQGAEPALCSHAQTKMSAIDKWKPN